MMPKTDKKKDWSLQNIPPKGDKDVGEFAFSLFEIARIEKERLGKPQDFLTNYALYRGKLRDSVNNRTRNKAHTPINLYFANIERTVSNITARQPEGEVVDLDGSQDGAEELFSVKLKKWWKDTSQQSKTRATARQMEIYGITPEKPYWDKSRKEPDISLTDPFAFFPAPGLYDDLSTESPYVCFAYLEFVDKLEADFDVSDVAEDSAYELLGVERERYKADGYDQSPQRIGNYADPMYKVNTGNDSTYSDAKISRGLIMEVWVRDTREKTNEYPLIDPMSQAELFDDNGNAYVERVKEPVYPDGIRKITITRGKPGAKTDGRSAFIVLDDSANPNINPALEIELAETTHPWGRFPCYTANSYRDLVSIWGFAAAEQVGDLLYKINKIVSRLVSYVNNVMSPPLIVQKNCGITRNMIKTELGKDGRLILMPTTPNARIEFLQIPNLPATFFQVLDLIIKLFDRVYQIEDADRGQAPSGVIAASAIVALQERNQVMMQAKTASIDALAEQRARWAIGLWQNFGTREELIEVGDELQPFIGSQYAGRQFSFVIQAGSTTPRTTLHVQEMAQALYTEQAIDRRALLEAVNFPNWKQVDARMASGQLQQILEVLVEDGRISEDEAMSFMEVLQSRESQSDSGGSETRTVKPAGAKSGQGQQPPTEVRG